MIHEPLLTHGLMMTWSVSDVGEAHAAEDDVGGCDVHDNVGDVAVRDSVPVVDDDDDDAVAICAVAAHC